MTVQRQLAVGRMINAVLMKIVSEIVLHLEDIVVKVIFKSIPKEFVQDASKMHVGLTR